MQGSDDKMTSCIFKYRVLMQNFRRLEKPSKYKYKIFIQNLANKTVKPLNTSLIRYEANTSPKCNELTFRTGE